MPPPPPRSTLFPYTTLFRSKRFLDPVSTAMITRLQTLDVKAPIEDLLPLFERGRVAIVMDGDKFRSEEHTSELQSPVHLVCRLLLEKKKRELYMTRRVVIRW